ncbi:homeobox-leucine zipper protein ROC9 [Oryza brachyantha]|uniref:homeobox-leucine zipper protein ROC9 n=1 Tax=Oryza brachyantha TaxID=4533 RepID=UPI001ADABBC1|nr:homeobox-leucine zipper protein ROC9 [Oryza brachyantha]
MGTNRPPPRTKDFFAAPVLSLSLAGVFGRDNGPPAAAAAGGDELEEGDEVQAAAGEAVEISSSGNTGPGGSRSQSGGGSGEDGGHDAADGGGDRKRRKNYHRHTAEQIRVMEALFKESPHPDERQRQLLSKQLGLSARQVKFWFQNRRTQIKAIQERHENSLLKSVLDKLQQEHRAMRELARKPSRCPNCGAAAASGDAAVAAATREQRLRLENAKLKAEIEKLRGTPGKATAADGAASPPRSATAARTNCKSPPLHGHDDRPRILELAGRALDELVAMCSSGEPLWVRAVETGRDILNYDEYVRLFRRDHDGSGDQLPGWSVEVSRECGLAYLDTMQFVHAFMDVERWKELFPSMISNAAVLDVISTGEDDGRDGVVQLMYAELQMLTPMVPTREFYFARHCKKLAAERWAIVDVSTFDEFEAGVHASSPVRCFKKPSGCVIEEQTNGQCKVTWVEHTRCRRRTVPPVYRAVTASGVAFGARRWVAALQLQCERMVFAVATNVPTRDSNGVSTLAGRRSVLKLAHRMTSSLCRTIGGSRDMMWSRAPKGGGGDDIWWSSRTNSGDDPGEPQGLVTCAALSTWLPVNPTAILDLLRDESRRPEWDVMLPGNSLQICVNLAKGKDRTNCVTVYAVRPEDGGGSGGGKWVLQDICTNPCESTTAYAAIDAAALQPVTAGHDSSGVAFLPCGFISVMPDGLESRPAVITASGNVAAGAGSLVTVAFQVLASSSPAATLATDSLEAATGLVSSTLDKVRKALGCEDDF